MSDTQWVISHLQNLVSLSESVISFYTDDLPDTDVVVRETEKIKALNMAIEMISRLEGLEK